MASSKPSAYACPPPGRSGSSRSEPARASSRTGSGSGLPASRSWSSICQTRSSPSSGTSAISTVRSARSTTCPLSPTMSTSYGDRGAGARGPAGGRPRGVAEGVARASSWSRCPASPSGASATSSTAGHGQARQHARSHPALELGFVHTPRRPRRPRCSPSIDHCQWTMLACDVAGPLGGDSLRSTVTGSRVTTCPASADHRLGRESTGMSPLHRGHRASRHARRTCRCSDATPHSRCVHHRCS